MLELDDESKIIKKLKEEINIIEEICSWLPPDLGWLDGRKVYMDGWT